MHKRNAFQNKILGVAEISEVLLIFSLIVVLFFLITQLRPSSKPSPPPSPEYSGLKEQTAEAYKKLVSLGVKFPHQESTFTVEYIHSIDMFSVNIKASSWEEYARVRREEGADFFKKRGIDPCQIYIAWGAPKELLDVPMPDLDFGCD